MKTPWIIMLAAMALISAVPGAVADHPHAYVSGECYNEDASAGGQDAVGVDGSGNVMILNPGAGGVVDAASWFATQSVEDGGQTGQACEHNGTGGPNDSDHLQVRAGAGDIEVVVCYDGQANIEPSRCPALGGH
jgi:hypothetical protein